MRVVHHVFYAVDGAYWYTDGFKPSNNFLRVMLCTPISECLINSCLMNNSSRVMGELGVVSHVLAASLNHEPLIDRVAIATNDDVFAVFALVGISGNDAGNRCARGFTNGACAIELWHHTF